MKIQKINFVFTFLFLLLSISLTSQNNNEESFDFVYPFSDNQMENDFIEMGGDVFMPLENGSYTLIKSLPGNEFARIKSNLRTDDGLPMEFDCSNIVDAPLECRADLPPVDFNLPICVHSDGDPILSALTIIPGNSGCPGDPVSISRTYFGQDTSGNMDECMQTFTVESQNGPVFTFFPNDTLLGCYTDSTDPSNTGGAAVAASSCSNFTITVDYSDVSDQSAINDYIYTITRTWTATDGCGRVISQDQIIDVDSTVGCPNAIPTLGQWGIIILMLLFFTIGIVYIKSENLRKVFTS